MTKKFRWGILGTGYIAKKFATALTFVDDAELYAVGSRTSNSAEAFAKEYSIPVSYGDYQGLVEDPNVDIVYVGTTNSIHRVNCLQALEAGKPVLCEKPFMVNSREAIDVINVAKKKNLFLMEALWTRYIPAFKKARQMWENGAIGDVYTTTSDIGFIYERSIQHPLYNPALAGGALLDLGAYPVSMAHIAFGEPDTVKATAFLGPTGVDEQIGMLFGYKGGQVSIGLATFKTSAPMEATVYGTKGYIRIHAPFYKPTSFTLRLNGQDPQLIEVPHLGNGWNYEAIEVMECLRAGKLESELAPHAETLALMRTMDRIRENIGLKYPMD